MRLLFILIGMLAGCATPIQPNQNGIVFQSNPPGATISSAGVIWGVAPVGRIWTFTGGRTTDVSAPITARWVSGATSTTRLNLVAGKEGTYVFNRPVGVAGLEADVQWAIHIQQEARRKSDEESAAFAAALKSYNDDQERSRQQNTSPSLRNTDCTSMGGGRISCTSY
jgi:hypothetical protein